MEKVKHSICRGCQVSYPRKNGAKTGRYCSDKCKDENKGLSKKYCEPECKPEHIEIKTVIFKDGTQHSRRACILCRKASYIPRCTPVIPVSLETKKSISSLYRYSPSP